MRRLSFESAESSDALRKGRRVPRVALARPVSACYGSHECFVFRTPRLAGAWRTEVYGRSLKAPEAPRPELSASSCLSSEKAKYFEALRKAQAPASAASVFCNHMATRRHLQRILNEFLYTRYTL